ncbi:MAG: hypothetical protein Ta2B_18110 [Termitinemataceae bacterium]|nr:MAG: hypothetical protein Ta2B_18110 [Termitinemataceae bacterium]
MKYYQKLFLINLLIINIYTVNANDKIDNEEDEKNKYLVLEDDYKISPSGTYKLFLNSNGDERYFTFYITGIDDNIVFIEKERYYKRFTFFLCWDDNLDIVWCYSGDMGTYFWTNKDDTWEKNDYYMNKRNGYNPPYINPPHILKKLRPKYFKERTSSNF